MAKDTEKKQGFVEHITPRDVDFSQWYTDVILKSELVDYAPVRGCMVIRPYGFAIWEHIKEQLDRRFKESGHENVYMPMLLSLIHIWFFDWQVRIGGAVDSLLFQGNHLFSEIRPHLPKPLAYLRRRIGRKRHNAVRCLLYTSRCV